MGTIAEMLGLNLSEPEDNNDALVALVTESGSDTQKSCDDESSATGDEEHDPVGETVMVAILEETGVEPDQARPDMTLQGELDMDQLSLYGAISVIEHDLSIVIPDAEIEGWVTLSDLLDGVRKIAHSST